MTYSIRLPDGSLVQNIPDEVTPEEAKRRLIAAMPELASKERTWGQAAGDIGAALISGTGAALQFPGQVAGLLPGMRGFGEALATPGEKIAEFGKSLKSEGLKAREAIRNKAMSEAEKEGVLAEFATAIKSTISDPALLSTFLTEQVPQLIGPAAAAKITTMLGRGAIKAAATEEAAKEAAKALGARATTAAVGTGAAMQGADIGEETYKEAYKLAKAQGLSDEEAQSTALAKARVAAVEAGLISVGAQRLPGGKAIERRLAGLPGQGRIRGALGEAVSEMVEEGGGAFAKNVGLQEIDPTRSLTAGIGTAAGLGAIGGAGLGAVIGARPTAETPAATPGELPIERARREKIEAETEAVLERTKGLPSDQDILDAAAKPDGVYALQIMEQRIKESGRKGAEVTDALRAIKRARGLAEQAAAEPEQGVLPLVGRGAKPTPMKFTAPTKPKKGEPAETEELPEQEQLAFDFGEAETPPATPTPPAETEAEIPEPTVRGETPTQPTNVLGDTAIRGIGFAANKGAKSVYQQLLGKDISNPEDVQTIRTVLEKYKQSKTANEKTVAKIDAFLATLPEVATTEPENVAGSVEPPSGAGVGVAGEPGAGAATAGAGAVDTGRVVPPESDVGEPAGGKGEQPRAVTEPTTLQYTEEDIDKAEALGILDKEAADRARAELAESEETPSTGPSTETQTQIDEIKAQMQALRQKNGRLPALKSPRRAQYDALQAKLDALAPPEKGALKERLEQAEATGVFSVRDGKPILDLPAVREALKDRDPKMFKAILTYIGVDEDGNYLPTTYSADDAAQSVGLAKSSGANVRRTAEALGITADVISRFQAAQTGVIGIAKNVSEASLSGISVENPKAGVLYEPPAKPVKTEEELDALAARVKGLEVNGKPPAEKDPNYKPYRNAVKALTQATPKTQRFLRGAVNRLGVLDFTKLDDRQLADIYSRASRYDAKDNAEVMQQLNAEVEKRRAVDRRGMDAAINRAYGKLVEEEETQAGEEVPEEGIDFSTAEEVEDTTARLSDEDISTEARTQGEFYPELSEQGRMEIESQITGMSIPELADYVAGLFKDGDQKLIAQAVARRIRAQEAAGVKFGIINIVNPGVRAPTAVAVGSARAMVVTSFDKGVISVNMHARGATAGNSGLDARTLLHELVHAATTAAIDLGNRRGAIGSNVAKFSSDMIRLTNAVISHLNVRFKSGQQLTDVEEAIYKRNINALLDPHEVLAWGLTSPAVQEYLETIPYQGRSVWTKFVDAIRSFLGLPAKANTALSELLHLAEEVFQGDPNEEVAIASRMYSGAPPSTTPTISAAAQLTPQQVQAQPIGQAEKTGVIERMGAQPVQYLRAKLADSLAAVDAFFAEKYGGRVKDNMGNANPIVLLSRALDSMRFSKMAQETGTLRKDAEGLMTAQKLIAGNQFNLIAGEEVSYLKALQELKRHGLDKDEVGKVLIGHREHGLRTLVRAGQSDYAMTLTDQQIDAYERRFQADKNIQRISQMLDAVRFSMIDNMVDAGRIDAAKAAEWKAATGYIPFSRIDKLDNFFEATGAGRRGAAVYKNMKEISGDPTRRLENPLDTFSSLMDWMSNEAMKNDAASKALQEMSLFNAAERIPAREAKSSNQQGAIVETFVNGNRVLYYIPDPAMLGAFVHTPPNVTGVLKVLQQGSRVLRAGVTSMPPFVMKQVVDDIVRMYTFAGLQNNREAVARVLFNFPKNWFNEMVGRKSAGVRALEERGLVGTFDFTESGNVKDIMSQAGVSKRSIGSRVLQVMEAGAKASDLAVRQAIYEQVLKETGSEAEAENRAREIINFSRRGNAKVMDYMIRMVPFFNAFARGTDKLLVAASGGAGGVGQSVGQPRAVFWKRMGMLASMATVYALMMSDDDEYNKLPDRIRDRNIIIPVGKEFVQKYGFVPAVSLPADLALIFKAIPERVVQYYKLYGTPEERTLLQITSELAKQGYDIFSTPNITPQLLRPIFENMANYSFFLDRPLESQMQQNLRPFERYGMGTSETAKALGNIGEDIRTRTGMELFAVSPIKIENFIRGFLGTIGGTVLAVGDALINPSRTDRPLQAQLIPQLTGASAFMKDGTSSRFLDEMYKMDREAEQVRNTYKRLSEKDPAAAERLLLDNYGLYSMRDSIHGVMKSLQQLNKTALEIDKMVDLSPKDRRDIITALREEQNVIARQAYELRRLVASQQMEVDKLRR